MKCPVPWFIQNLQVFCSPSWTSKVFKHSSPNLVASTCGQSRSRCLIYTHWTVFRHHFACSRPYCGMNDYRLLCPQLVICLPFFPQSDNCFLRLEKKYGWQFYGHQHHNTGLYVEPTTCWAHHSLALEQDQGLPCCEISAAAVLKSERLQNICITQVRVRGKSLQNDCSLWLTEGQKRLHAHHEEVYPESPGRQLKGSSCR